LGQQKWIKVFWSRSWLRGDGKLGIQGHEKGRQDTVNKAKGNKLLEQQETFN
jgi:hypothetical protein